MRILGEAATHSEGTEHTPNALSTCKPAPCTALCRAISPADSNQHCAPAVASAAVVSAPGDLDITGMMPRPRAGQWIRLGVR